MNGPALITIAIAILGFGLVSRRLEDSFVTPPIAFVALGLAATGLGFVDFHIDESSLDLLAELTLVIILFADASRIQLQRLKEGHDLPVRLLLIGLPLTILLGALVATSVFPELTLWEAALLAAVLAPTDAALGQAVVSSPLVPIRIRQALNVESGLNDGIALPVILLFLSACASAVPGLGGTAYWLRFALLQVTLGPLIGISVGWLGGHLVAGARRRGWMNTNFQHLAALGLALLAFAVANLVGGNGFIAAFCAGLALGNTVGDAVRESLNEFAEAEGQLLTLMVFLVFGAYLLPSTLGSELGPSVLYACISLTVIRMIPVSLSLIGTGLHWPTHLFLGWFGPRGVASILFGLLVVNESQLAVRHEIFATVLITVLLSVVLHGTTASIGAGWYARHTEAMDRDRSPEHQPVADIRTRLRRTR
ncbi:MAG: cation:proton antiporter [Thermoanaerobaculia bacterium]|nr:cation:proton antiporter [Thermoanaerobaculia bacterium]